MAENSRIGWTTHTFNPWRGCTKVSDGCKNCYAEAMSKRNPKVLGIWGDQGTRVIASEAKWREPVKWNREAFAAERPRVFCASLADVFENRPELVEPRQRLFRLISETPNLDWLLLTKRPELITASLPQDWGQGWPNVWLGTSVEDMRVAQRADFLRVIPAAVRFISYEPAIGPLDDFDMSGIDWLIYGGESGNRYREENKDWARSLRRKCYELGIAFFHKQSNNRHPGRGVELDGEVVQEFPTPRARQLHRIVV